MSSKAKYTGRGGEFKENTPNTLLPGVDPETVIPRNRTERRILEKLLRNKKMETKPTEPCFGIRISKEGDTVWLAIHFINCDKLIPFLNLWALQEMEAPEFLAENKFIWAKAALLPGKIWSMVSCAEDDSYWVTVNFGPDGMTMRDDIQGYGRKLAINLMNIAYPDSMGDPFEPRLVDSASGVSA